jgi:hypothetical protein
MAPASSHSYVTTSRCLRDRPPAKPLWERDRRAGEARRKLSGPRQGGVGRAVSSRPCATIQTREIIRLRAPANVSVTRGPVVVEGARYRPGRSLPSRGDGRSLPYGRARCPLSASPAASSRSSRRAARSSRSPRPLRGPRPSRLFTAASGRTLPGSWTTPCSSQSSSTTECPGPRLGAAWGCGGSGTWSVACPRGVASA